MCVCKCNGKAKNMAANTWQRKQTHGKKRTWQQQAHGAHGMGRNCGCFVIEMIKHVCVNVKGKHDNSHPHKLHMQRKWSGPLSSL